MNAESEPTPETPATPRPKPWRWTWFVVGFVVVFVGMLFLRMEYYDGRAVHATKLWQYYLLEIRHTWNSTGNLGLKSGSTVHAIYVALQHVICAAVGGSLLMGGAWVIGKRSRLIDK